jgi:hypothetical protein
MSAFAVSPAAEASARRLGKEGAPLLMVDNVLADPEAARDIAIHTPFGDPVSIWYPGVNAALPQDYLEALLPALRPSLQRVFGIAPDRRLSAHGFFALSTRRAEELTLRQRIPHYDHAETDILACVHYLAHDQGGGTGFFRHDASGFEAITPDRREAYMAAIDSELAAQGAALTGFAGPDTPGFTLTEAVEARFNRLIIYPACVLHCALFDGARLSDDPRTGRLTANSFIRAV